MSFCTTYKRILDDNIRNIYSGPIRTADWCLRGKYSKFADIASPKLEDDKNNFQRKRIIYRFLEYLPEYRIYIPRAPAFNEASKSQINDFIQRNYHCKRSSNSRCGSSNSNTEKRKRFTDEEMRVVSARVSKSTVSSEIRNLQTKDPISSLPDIRNACQRREKQPSQRYFPEAYVRMFQKT